MLSLERLSRLASALPHLGIAVVAMGGIMKAVDPAAFAKALSTWKLLSPGVQLLTLALVPCLEIGIGLAWLRSGPRRRDVLAAIATTLLAIFTAAYALHVIFAEVPDCGCFGKILLVQDSVDAAQHVVARNAAIMAALLLRFRAPR